MRVENLESQVSLSDQLRDTLRSTDGVCQLRNARVSFDELQADVRAQDVSEPRLYRFIGETDSRYHEVDARLHRQVLASNHQATEIVHLRQEMAQGRCRCHKSSGESPISQPRSVYGDEEGRKIFGSEYSLGAVGSGSNSTQEAPIIDEGNLVPREVQVEGGTGGSSTNVGPEIEGQDTMLELVEQELLEAAWGIERRSPTPEEELTDSSVGERITEAWFKE